MPGAFLFLATYSNSSTAEEEIQFKVTQKYLPSQMPNESHQDCQAPGAAERPFLLLTSVRTGQLFTALREVSLLPERPGTQYDMSVVSSKHPTCPSCVPAHKAPALVDVAGAVRAPAAFAPCRGHPAGMLAFGISMMLCSPHEDQSSGDHTHCLSQAHCLQHHRHVCLPQRQPIAAHPSLFYIYIILQH